MESFAMQGIKPLWDIMPLMPAQQGAAQPVGAEGGGMFTNIFQSAIENVRQTDAEKNRLQYLMAVGELDNPAEMNIAASQAQMSVELLIQLRNKAVDAYSELTRISL